jgi:hypothetical protein
MFAEMLGYESNFRFQHENVQCFIDGVDFDFDFYCQSVGQLKRTDCYQYPLNKFYIHLLRITNIVLYNLFWTYTIDPFHSDECLRTLCLNRHDAVSY